LLARLQRHEADHHPHWDLRGISVLDHTGAQLLWNHWGRRWPAQLSASPAQRGTLQRVAQFTTAAPAPSPSTGWLALQPLGDRLWATWDHAVAAVALLGHLTLELLRLLRRPHRGPWREVSAHLAHMGASALPITALVGFLIGVVLAYLVARQLRQLGADAYIVPVLGIALVRELGPMLAAILVAGRSGSAITAQLGVMRVTEELDALRVMGISRHQRLVLPRVLALAGALPLVALWTTAAALAGAMLATEAVLGLPWRAFLEALPRALPVANLWLGLGKSLLFGAVIAAAGCHFGLRVAPDTASLGAGTTASVVASITAVLLLDALLAVVFKGVGL